MMDWTTVLEPVRTWWRRPPPVSVRPPPAVPIERSAPHVPSDYVCLHTYLEHRYASMVVLTFEQMEALLGSALPAAAYTEPDWWTGDGVDMPSHSAAWVRAGRVATPNLSARTVTFERSGPGPSLTASVVLIVIVLGLQAANPQASEPSRTRDGGDGAPSATLVQAQRFFYNGDYDRSAAVTEVLCAARPDDLEACELRTASLLFQIKKALGEAGARDRATAWKQCAACPRLMAAFLTDTARGQTNARARLAARPDDEETLFFLGKVDLNYVWLQSGTLGRKTGWDEYWEARRSLDRVLELNPGHVRARVARAWVDYIVGTSVPRGVRWILGGGNKKRGLLAVREVVERGGGESFDQVEAMFALWDMQVREREVAGAVATARTLARDFPENRELRKFLTLHDPMASVINPDPPTR